MANTNIQLQALITKLEQLENETLLQRVSDFLDGILAASEETKKDWWDELPKEVQQAYQQGLQEMEAGEEIDFEDFIKQARQ